jgi:hypothetical protein
MTRQIFSRNTKLANFIGQKLASVPASNIAPATPPSLPFYRTRHTRDTFDDNHVGLEIPSIDLFTDCLAHLETTVHPLNLSCQPSSSQAVSGPPREAITPAVINQLHSTPTPLITP